MSSTTALARALATVILVAPVLAHPIDALAAKGGGSGGSKADRTAPTVSITSPASGTTYATAQTVTIAATASDNVGVARVEFYRNGALAGTDSAAPYSYAWSISSSLNGSHSWTARAFDAKGNNSTSSAVSLSVNIGSSDATAPSTSIASPTSGTTYTTVQTVTVTANASDNVGVSKVEFYRNGALAGTDTASPYSYAWSISSSLNGSHSWTSKAYDAAGNAASSAASSVTVNIAAADTTAPTVSLTSPASGATYTTVQTVNVTAAASDNVGVTRVEFYDNGVQKSIVTAAPFTYAWSVSSALNGTHSWTAKAFDAAGNSTTSSAVGVTVNVAAADTTAPTVSITSPASGTSYTSAQTVTITASAADNVGVSRVEFYDGSTLKGSDSSSPFSYAWSVSSTVNGTHSWTAKAFDAAGNSKASTAVSLSVNVPVATAGAYKWSRQFGGATTADQASGSVTAIDANGEVFVVATVSGSVDMGSGSQVASTGGVVLSKYSADGTSVRWSRLWTRDSTSSEFQPKGIAVNADGSVVVVGNFYGTLNLGGGALTSVGGYDVFMVKYSSTGLYQWSQRIGGAGSEYATGVAVDSLGSLLLTGWAQGTTVSFGGASLSTVSGSRDVFLARYGANGAHLWSKTFGGSSADQGLAVAVDAGGNATITGEFAGSVSFGGATLSSAGSTDIFVATFSSGGIPLQSWREGGTSADQGRAIGIDGLGNIDVAASFQGSMVVGGQTLTSTGATDIALMQYSSTGTLRWVHRFGGSNSDQVNSLATNGAGEIAITGIFVSWTRLGGNDLFADGSVNVLFAKYDVNGTHKWSRVAGVNWDDYGNGVAIDGNGEVVATGSFYKGIDLGGGLLSTLEGSTDGFLVRYGP